MLSRSVLLSTLCLLLLVMTVLSLMIGTQEIPLWQGMIDLLIGKQSVPALIIGQLRLPRTMLAIGIGGTLGLSGATLQGVMRNPLADPGLLGISGWASLGAVLAFYTGFSHVWPFSLPFAALMGALIATIALLMLSRGGVLVLILTGAALGALSTALVSLVLNLVPSPYASYEIMHWLMGSLSQTDMTDLLLALPCLVLGTVLLMGTGKALDGLVLGDDVAQTLGVSPRTVQRRIILGTALAVGSGVAVAGGIGFVGLVVPHIARTLVGARPSAGLLPSTLLGAVLLLGADMVVRTPFQGPELQLGVVTALIGTPFFLWQISRLHRRGSDT